MFKQIISIITCSCLLFIPVTSYASNIQENNIQQEVKSKETVKVTQSIKQKNSLATSSKSVEESTNSTSDSSKEETTKPTEKVQQENTSNTNNSSNKQDSSNKDKSTKKESNSNEKSTDNDKEDTKKETKGDSNFSQYSSNNESTSAYKHEIKYYSANLSTVLRYPLAKEGSITTYFGSIDSVHSHPHAGIDIGISSGTPVLAAESGVIIRASWFGGYGNCIDIQHEDGSITRYGHLSQINVQVNDKVLRGQLIGKVGNTGRSTGPHLHFEYYPPNSEDPIDGLALIKKITDKYNYINTKFTFIDKNKVNDNLSLENLNTEDIYFQFNEQIKPAISEGKTYINIYNYINNGLIDNLNDIKVFTKNKKSVNIINNNIVINGEVTQEDIQILIPSNDFTKKSIPVFINNGLTNEIIKDKIYEFNPLFDMNIEINADNITKENIYVKINDKELGYNQFDYSNNILTLHYSSLNVNNIKISITAQKHEAVKSTENSINKIISWIESDNIDMMRFNSFISGCYFINSNMNNNVSEKPSVYNKYNNDNSESHILIDDTAADGYVSIPVDLMLSSIHLRSDVDKYIDDNGIKINDKEYNDFIYGEKLNILDNTKVKEGYKDVNFSIIDYIEDAKYNYFIVSYEVEGIGGYFGIKIEK